MNAADTSTAPGRGPTSLDPLLLADRWQNLEGPIPLDWLSAAARLPGKCLHVGIALWFVGGLQRSDVVSLSNMTALRFGLDRNAKYRALTWLEQAGLIAVERKLGRPPMVTILTRRDVHDREF